MVDNNINARRNNQGLGRARGRGFSKHKDNPIIPGDNTIPTNSPHLYPSLLSTRPPVNHHYQHNEAYHTQIEPSAPEMRAEYLPGYSQISYSSSTYRDETGENYQMPMDNFSQHSEDYPCNRSTISNISSYLESGENVNYSELFDNNIKEACLAIQNSVRKMKIELEKISEAKINQIWLYANPQREKVKELAKTKRTMCQSKMRINRSAPHKTVDEASEELVKKEDELKKEIMDIIEIKINFSDEKLSNTINEYIQVDTNDNKNKSMKKLKENAPLLDIGRNITVNVKKGKGKYEMDKCMGIVIDQTDNIDDIYVCDAGNNRIQVYKRNGEHIRSIIFKDAKSPYSIAVNSTHIFITCHYNLNQVHLSCKEKYDTSGRHTIIGLDTIQWISVDANQTEVFLVENGRVKAYNSDMKKRIIEHIKLKSITYYIKILDEFIFLLGLDGNKFSVYQYNLNGGGCNLNFKVENLTSPKNFCIDREGSMFFIDNNYIVEMKGIKRIVYKETIQNSTALTLNSPKGISIDSRGVIVVCDAKDDWIIQELK